MDDANGHTAADTLHVFETHPSCVKEGEWFVAGDRVSKISAPSRKASFFSDLFLPSGYPESVRRGYAQYQIWDLIQGLSSYLRGALVTKELLRGFGVGDAQATAAAGAVGWIIRDGAGMAGSLLFSGWASSDFDRGVRQWRLFADLVNDLGLTLNMLAPLFGRRGFILATVGASLLSSMCGVAAGATKAAISQWFALNDNLADCVAKEGTQETAVNILGLIGGLVLCFNFEQKVVTWGVFIILTALHVVANMRAVTALRFSSVNDYRFTILFERFWNDQVDQMSVKDVADAEPWLPSMRSPTVAMGDRLDAAKGTWDSEAILAIAFRTACSRDAKYLIVHSAQGSGDGVVKVLMHPRITPEETIKARFHAQCVQMSRTMTEERWTAFREALMSHGWSLDYCLLSSRLWRYDWCSEQRKDI